MVARNHPGGPWQQGSSPRRALECVMLAVHLDNGRVSARHIRRPQRPEGFALIRLLAAGICNTDLELQRGYYGFSGIPGHEFVGEVVEADTPSLIGKRVVGEINVACHHCVWCRCDLGRYCPHRTFTALFGSTR